MRSLRERGGFGTDAFWVIMPEDDSELNAAVTDELIAAYAADRSYRNAVIVAVRNNPSDVDERRTMGPCALFTYYLQQTEVDALARYWRLVQFASDVVVVSRHEPFAFGSWIGSFGITPAQFVHDVLFYGSPINWLWWEADADIKSAIAANAHRLAGKRVLVYGLTRYAAAIVETLRANNIPVDAAFDSNESKAGWNASLSVEVHTISDALEPYDAETAIVIVSKYAREMRATLARFGYREDQVVEIPIEGGICAARDDSQLTLDDMFQLVLDGVNARRALGDEHLVVCQSGTGDVYYACALLPAYLQAYGKEACTLALPDSPSAIAVARMFGLQNLAPFPVEKLYALYKAWDFLGGERLNMKPMLNLGSRLPRKLLASTNALAQAPWMHWLTCIRLQYFVFDGPFYLSAPQQNASPGLESHFRSLGFRKGRSVLLAPYANAFQSALATKTDFWERLASELANRGYDVATNCAGEERPIEGTSSCLIPHDKIISFLNYAGGFIGIRSGLCDVAQTAFDCTMVLLYERNVGVSKEMWSLKKMGLRDDAVEFEYTGDIDGLLSEILPLFPVVEKER